MNKVILQANDLFKNAGFCYNVCGGYAFDIHAGVELRTHGDLDIAVFVEDKLKAVKFLHELGWPIFGRFMQEGKMATQILFYKVDNPDDKEWAACKNFWAIKPGSYLEMYEIERLPGVYSYKRNETSGETAIQRFDFIELEIDARINDEYIVRDEPKISRKMDKAVLYKDDVPYLAPEIILFLKADKASMEHPVVKIKTEKDFKAIMPLLDAEQKEWLINAIETAYPEGYAWLDGLL